MKRKINIHTVSVQLFMCLLLFSCNQKDGYFVDGSFPGHDGEQVMLFRFEGNEIITSVDTAIVKNGKFHFKGPEDKAWLAIITSGNHPGRVFSTQLILEGGKIDVLLDTVSRISGTHLNDLFASTDFDSLPYEQRLKLVRENINNAFGRALLLYENEEYEYEVFYSLFELLDEQVKAIPELENLLSERKKEAERDEQHEKGRSDSINSSFVDFELTDRNGNIKKISDYVGQSDYLFIDFWASWCGPCIADIPHVKATYEKYKDRGLNVIAISLDTNRERWKNALNRIDAPWPQLLIAEGKENDIREAYHFQGIPYALLLDRNGIILEVGLQGHSLDACMNEILNLRF